MKKARISASPCFFGADERSRTSDLLITNQLLYQLSYISKRTQDYKAFGLPGQSDSCRTGADDDVYAIEYPVLRHVREVEDRYLGGVDVTQFAGDDIVEMMVVRGVGIVEYACRVDDDFAHQALLHAQLARVVDRCLGGFGLPAVDRKHDLVGREVLHAGQHERGDLDPLRCRRDAVLP